jgi:hypothetical protein
MATVPRGTISPHGPRVSTIAFDIRRGGRAAERQPVLDNPRGQVCPSMQSQLVSHPLHMPLRTLCVRAADHNVENT